MNDSENGWWEAFEETLAVGQQIVTSSAEVDKGCDHIVRLLADASLLFHGGSYATASFLAITALEETAKLHLGMYRSAKTSLPRNKDPLYRHDQKHRLAAAPTLLLGNRLQHAIGEQGTVELMEAARSGHLVKIREASLYMERKDGLQVPLDFINQAAATKLVLFAIEVFDDALVGYTNHSHVLRKQTDALFFGLQHA